MQKNTDNRSRMTINPVNCPLVSALRASAGRDAVAFHFPGHKRGEAAPPALAQLIGAAPFLHDITEHPHLDSFPNPTGPLLEAKTLAARLFGAKETWFLVNGTSCGVQAAVMATCSPGDTIILPRNAHVSATAGVILSAAHPKYICPQYNPQWDVVGGITPLQVKVAIAESEMEDRKVGAVMITSPTYNGVCSRLEEISRICHNKGIPVIVDEAHGAHFKFHPELPKTALQQGADISIQSTHKVLFSFSQSSMLHISGEMIDRERLHKCLHLLQATSPNWLLLASLDATRHQLSTTPKSIFSEALKLANRAKSSIAAIPGISVLNLSDFANVFPAMDPLRITINVSRLGLSGFRANEILINDLDIVPETVSASSVVLALSPGTTGEDVDRLVSGLKQLSAQKCDMEKFPIVENLPGSNAVVSLNPREAFFSSKMAVKFEDSCGEVCGECICPFPPGVPLLIPGEVITEEALFYLQQIRCHGGCVIGAADPLLHSIVVCKID